MDAVNLFEIFNLINPILGSDDADRLEGTDANDFMFGLAGNDVINGGNEIDFLFGNDGDDTLIGDLGNDSISGAHGNDLLIWNNGDGSDRMDGGADHDTVQVNGADGPGDEFEVIAGGSDVLFSRLNLGLFTLDISSVETLEVNGQGGDDSLRVGDLSDTALAQVIFSGGSGNDTLDATEATRGVTAFGGEDNDILNGGLEVDTLNGNTGDDTIIGFRGGDFMNGGNGNDLLIWNNGDGSDFMNGGADHDTVQVNTADAAGDDIQIGADAETGFFFERINLGQFKLDIDEVEILDVNAGGGDDRVRLIDGALSDTALDLDGGSEAIEETPEDAVNPLPGDTLDLEQINLSGFDSVLIDLDIDDHAGANAEPSSSLNGAMRLAKHAEVTEVKLTDFENVIGSHANEVIVGNSEANVLQGNGGDDIINGRGGPDTLTGGEGFDQFVFSNGEGGNVVTDFSIEQDRLVLDAESFGLVEGSEAQVQNVARDGDGTDAGLVDIDGSNNVFVLQGGFENAGQAADAVATALTDGGFAQEGAQAGFFVYFNVNLGVPRLFAVEDIDNVDSAIQQLTNLSDTPDIANIVNQVNFTADNFAFLPSEAEALAGYGDIV